jgi:hypothetical protein
MQAGEGYVGSPGSESPCHVHGRRVSAFGSAPPGSLELRRGTASSATGAVAATVLGHMSQTLADTASVYSGISHLHCDTSGNRQQ